MAAAVSILSRDQRRGRFSEAGHGDSFIQAAEAVAAIARLNMPTDVDSKARFPRRGVRRACANNACSAS